MKKTVLILSAMIAMSACSSKDNEVKGLPVAPKAGDVYVDEKGNKWEAKQDSTGTNFWMVTPHEEQRSAHAGMPLFYNPFFYYYPYSGLFRSFNGANMQRPSSVDPGTVNPQSRPAQPNTSRNSNFVVSNDRKVTPSSNRTTASPATKSNVSRNAGFGVTGRSSSATS